MPSCSLRHSWVFFFLSHCLFTHHPISASDRALVPKSSPYSSVSVLVLFCLSLAWHLLTELPASALGLFFTRQPKWSFSVNEITTLLWFVQTLQLPPFAFRRRPTPAVACSGLARVSTLGLICHGPRLSALQSDWMCSVSHTSLVSVTGPLFLCSALSFSSSSFRSQLRLLLRETFPDIPQPPSLLFPLHTYCDLCLLLICLLAAVDIVIKASCDGKGLVSGSLLCLRNLK